MSHYSVFSMQYATAKRPNWKVLFSHFIAQTTVYHRCSFEPEDSAYFAVEDWTEFIDLVTSLVVVMPKSLNEIRVMLQQTIQLPISLILVITFRSTSFVIADQEWTFHVFWGFVAFGFNCFFAGFSPTWYHEPRWLCLWSQILTLQTQIFVMIVCKSVIRSSNQMAWFADVIP